MEYLSIIQARLGSKRFKNKVLIDLEGKTILEHVVDRVGASKYIDESIVATSIKKENLAIIKLCSDRGVRVFCGSEDDVLDRFYQVAKLLKPKNIVRITADCPMIDPSVIDEIIEKHSKSNADYTSNTLEETYPDGEDVEVFTYKALEKAWGNANLVSEREHVTPYIKKHNEFKCNSVISNIDYSNKRWTIDQKEDYIFIKKIFENLYSQNHLFGIKDILVFLGNNPELEKINNDIIRNEGYLKSLKNDKTVS